MTEPTTYECMTCHELVPQGTCNCGPHQKLRRVSRGGWTVGEVNSPLSTVACNVYAPNGYKLSAPFPRDRAETIAAALNAAEHAPRVGVAVEGSQWLGMDDANGGASVMLKEYGAVISFGWLKGGAVPGGLDPCLLELSAPQLRALADLLADLHQCSGCEAWYRDGEICPACGEERTQ